MAKAFYFAYGSNMCSRRMSARVASSRAVATAMLPGRRLVFDKRGRDGSAKANLAEAADGEVWGVVWEIEAAAWGALDGIEGGYERISVEVVAAGGERLAAQTYVGRTLTPDPTPFEWYRGLLLEGAREHALPASFIARLLTLRVID